MTRDYDGSGGTKGRCVKISFLAEVRAGKRERTAQRSVIFSSEEGGFPKSAVRKITLSFW